MPVAGSREIAVVPPWPAGLYSRSLGRERSRTRIAALSAAIASAFLPRQQVAAASTGDFLPGSHLAFAVLGCLGGTPDTDGTPLRRLGDVAMRATLCFPVGIPLAALALSLSTTPTQVLAGPKPE